MVLPFFLAVKSRTRGRTVMLKELILCWRRSVGPGNDSRNDIEPLTALKMLDVIGVHFLLDKPAGS